MKSRKHRDEEQGGTIGTCCNNTHSECKSKRGAAKGKERNWMDMNGRAKAKEEELHDDRNQQETHMERMEGRYEQREFICISSCRGRLTTPSLR